MYIPVWLIVIGAVVLFLVAVERSPAGERPGPWTWGVFCLCIASLVLKLDGTTFIAVLALWSIVGFVVWVWWRHRQERQEELWWQNEDARLRKEAAEAIAEVDGWDDAKKAAMDAFLESPQEKPESTSS